MNDELTKSLHWLTLKNFGYDSDINGNEFIQLQTEIRAYVNGITQQLKEHNILIAKVEEHQQMSSADVCSRRQQLAAGDVSNQYAFDNICVDIAFSSREDLVLAKLILKCHE